MVVTCVGSGQLGDCGHTNVFSLRSPLANRPQYHRRRGRPAIRMASSISVSTICDSGTVLITRHERRSVPCHFPTPRPGRLPGLSRPVRRGAHHRNRSGISRPPDLADEEPRFYSTRSAQRPPAGQQQPPAQDRPRLPLALPPPALSPGWDEARGRWRSRAVTNRT